MQSLTYYTLSNTAVLQNNNGNEIFYNVSLVQTASFFQSGSSDASLPQLILTSGSENIAIFPYNGTNLYINSSSVTFATSSHTVNGNYTTVFNGLNLNPSYYFKISNSSSLEEIMNISLISGSNSGNVSLLTSSIYSLDLYSGVNKYNSISIFDSGNSFLYSSSWSGSQKTPNIYLEPTGSNSYYIVAEVSSSICCTPTLLSIDNINHDQLQFNFLTGSCGICSDLYIYESTDSIDYKLLQTGSFISPILTNSGSYPIVPTLYYIKQKCGTFFSDQSNTLGIIP